MADETTTTTLLDAGLSRRRFLQGTALAGFGAFLAACGGGATPAPSGAPGESAEPGDGGEITGPLNWANWPAYIDLNEDESASPTLEGYQEKYGIEVNYVEDIQSNEDFFATISPALQAGLDSGWDLMCLTDYMVARLAGLGWLDEIDPANVPNAVSNVNDNLKGIEWDPDFKYHFPYQSGADGIGYNVKSTGRDLKSIADMFDPAFKGKLTFLTGYQDTFAFVNLLLLARGEVSNTPPDMTNEDADKVYAFLKPYVDDGFIRAFTGNEYLQDFASGDTWVALVYSGDLASSGGPDDVFVYPDEGSIIWTDNFCIPKGAQHKRAAEAMIDYCYDPLIAAQMANWIYYLSPVKGAKEEIIKLDPEAADNQLLFPPPEVQAKSYPQPNLTTEEDAYFSDLSAKLEGA